ncbi:hypothetical protein IWZ03DRAFT_51271 [Phyllosticta citriasiana]|uniref:Secreted protein n=1 Tax=Phyllosticta citriasiana TaxID=595635 RepID=A0ABR1KE13_9PEZI
MALSCLRGFPIFFPSTSTITFCLWTGSYAHLSMEPWNSKSPILSAVTGCLCLCICHPVCGSWMQRQLSV